MCMKMIRVVFCDYFRIILKISPKKSFLVGTHQNHLAKGILMGTGNIMLFHEILLMPIIIASGQF